MALPVASEILTMDYQSRGLPLVDVPAKTGIDTQTMDYPSRGLPLVTNLFGAAASAVVRTLTTLMAGF